MKTIKYTTHRSQQSAKNMVLFLKKSTNLKISGYNIKKSGNMYDLYIKVK